MESMNTESSRLDGKAIHELAVRTQRPEDEVRQVFEDELRATEMDARVKTFVPVFAKRRTLERLTERGRPLPRR
jgi:hypothetical protein